MLNINEGLLNISDHTSIDSLTFFDLQGNCLKSVKQVSESIDIVAFGKRNVLLVMNGKKGYVHTYYLNLFGNFDVKQLDHTNK